MTSMKNDFSLEESLPGYFYTLCYTIVTLSDGHRKSKIINSIFKTSSNCFVCAKFTNLEKDLTKSGFELYTMSPAGKRKGENENVKRN